MVRKQSSSPSSASPFSPLFKHDCIFEILEDSKKIIDPVQLSDSLKYEVISVCQQLCENGQLSPKAEVELANYIMDATKSRLEKAAKKELICYGYIVETKMILMATSDNDLPDVISTNIITIKFSEPINLILHFYQVQQVAVPSISQ
uniref:Uncharacterized protein n=1 Tax=Panagrolaimus davidi TaxID=227884 RepID=A0A914Q507_9BILA